MITTLGQLPNVILLLSIVLVIYYLNNRQLYVAFKSRRESFVDAILNIVIDKLFKNKNVQTILKHISDSDKVTHMNHFNPKLKKSQVHSLPKPNLHLTSNKEDSFESPCFAANISNNTDKSNTVHWDTMIDINDSDFVKQEKLRKPVYKEPITSETSRTNDNLLRLNAVLLGGNSDRYTGTIEDLYDEIVKGS